MIGDGPGSGGGGGGTAGAGSKQDVRDVALQEESGDHTSTVEELREQLEMAQARIEELERLMATESARYELERLLEDAGAIDLETALVLAERMLAEGGVTPAEAVARLVKSKAYLFRSAQAQAPAAGRGASSLSGEPTRAADSLEALAAEARESGDRRAVLRYLRRRRG